MSQSNPFVPFIGWMGWPVSKPSQCLNFKPPYICLSVIPIGAPKDTPGEWMTVSYRVWDEVEITRHSLRWIYLIQRTPSTLLKPCKPAPVSVYHSLWLAPGPVVGMSLQNTVTTVHRSCSWYVRNCWIKLSLHFFFTRNNGWLQREKTSRQTNWTSGVEITCPI